MFLLKKLGLQHINMDYKIFIIFAGINSLIVSWYINNIKIIGAKVSDQIKKVKGVLDVIFEMINMGPISFYLGLKVEINCQKRSIKNSQPGFIIKIMEKYYLHLVKLCNISIKIRILLLNKGLRLCQVKLDQYQRMIRSIIFSMVDT